MIFEEKDVREARREIGELSVFKKGVKKEKKYDKREIIHRGEKEEIDRKG